MECVIIGIAGGTGSGKSTFTNRIKAHFGDSVTVIYHDTYYKSRDGIPFEERLKINYADERILRRAIRDIKERRRDL